VARICVYIILLKLLFGYVTNIFPNHLMLNTDTQSAVHCDLCTPFLEEFKGTPGLFLKTFSRHSLWELV